MVTPSRWFAGGKGLDEFRERMLSDRRIRNLVDYPKLYDGFPGVKIRGGISYFLWDRDHDGPCTVQTMWDGSPSASRSLGTSTQYDVLVRWNEAVPILEKVRASEVRATLERASVQPEALRASRPTSTGRPAPKAAQRAREALRLAEGHVGRASRRSRSTIEWVDDWKVLMTAVQGTSAAVETQVPEQADPRWAQGLPAPRPIWSPDASTQRRRRRGTPTYLRTRFVRFLVSLRKQHAARARGMSTPSCPTSRSTRTGPMPSSTSGTA